MEMVASGASSLSPETGPTGSLGGVEVIVIDDVCCCPIGTVPLVQNQ